MLRDPPSRRFSILRLVLSDPCCVRMFMLAQIGMIYRRFNINACLLCFSLITEHLCAPVYPSIEQESNQNFIRSHQSACVQNLQSFPTPPSLHISCLVALQQQIPLGFEAFIGSLESLHYQINQEIYFIQFILAPLVPIFKQ